MKKYIFFDLDGTLTDPRVGITTCFAYALRDFGIETPDLHTLDWCIGPPLTESFGQFGFDEAQITRAIAKYRERFADVGIFENEVYPGVPDALAHLCAQGRTLAVATSKPWTFAERIIEKFGLAPYISFVSGSELDGRRNTKAEVIAYAFEHFGIGEAEKESCIMVGDRRHDIEGAKACGIASLGVRFGYALPGELEEAGADYIADDVKSMEAILLSL